MRHAVGTLAPVFVTVLCSWGQSPKPPEAPTSAQVSNFSGHWVLQGDGGTGGTGSGSGVVVERRPARELTLTQDARTLTISRTNASGEIKSVFNLDGTDSKNGNLVSNAAWKGSKLVITDKRDVSGTIVIRTATWWLEGCALKQEVRTVEFVGGSGPPTNEMVTTATYKKK